MIQTFFLFQPGQPLNPAIRQAALKNSETVVVITPQPTAGEVVFAFLVCIAGIALISLIFIWAARGK